MIQPRLYGRCGNQAFQIAAAIGYANKHNMEFAVPAMTLDMNKWPAYFPATQKRLASACSYVFAEHGFHYQEIPYHENLILDGYFQSEKYFREYESQVLEYFSMIPYIKDTGSVAVHVRRGDYLTLQDHHPTLSMDYYRRAIWLCIRAGYYRFKIFSDDIEWCKGQFTKDNFSRCIFNFMEGNTVVGDLSAMRSCEHNIIANSSFSWWGAWLNQNPNKFVISPYHGHWFGPALSHLDTSDLLPKAWLKIGIPDLTQ